MSIRISIGISISRLVDSATVLAVDQRVAFSDLQSERPDCRHEPRDTLGWPSRPAANLASPKRAGASSSFFPCPCAAPAGRAMPLAASAPS